MNRFCCWVLCIGLLGTGVAFAGPGMPLKGGPGNRVVFEPGPEQSSAGSLARWLEQNAGEKPMKVWLEIPVRLELSGNPLQPIESATLGFAKTLPFALKLDDTMMGIPLASRLQEFCPKLKGSCSVWMQGHWGTILPLMTSRDQVFTVRRLSRAKKRGESGRRAFLGKPDTSEADE